MLPCLMDKCIDSFYNDEFYTQFPVISMIFLILRHPLLTLLHQIKPKNLPPKHKNPLLQPQPKIQPQPRRVLPVVHPLVIGFGLKMANKLEEWLLFCLKDPPMPGMSRLILFQEAPHFLTSLGEARKMSVGLMNLWLADFAGISFCYIYFLISKIYR